MKTKCRFQVLIVSLLLTVMSSYGYSKKTLESKSKATYSTFYSFPSSLTGFDYEVNSGPSANQTFSINDGLLLTRPYTVTAPSGFEVSTSSSSGFSSSIIIPGAIIDLGSVTVYVRLASGLSINTYSGNLSITAPDATILTFYYPEVNETISLSGEVTRKESIWSGGSWSNGTPDIETIVTIDDDYSTSSFGNFSAWSLHINSGNQLTINDNTYIEVENDVVTEGTLLVATSGSFVQNNNSATFTLSGSGTASVNKSTSVLNNWYDYTYWSSPVNGAVTNDVFSSSHPNYRYWFNAQNYLDVLQETNNGNTYLAGHDDIDDDGDDWTLLGNTETLIPGVGYAATHSSTGFTSGNSYNYTFSGPFNTGTISTPIYYNGNNGDNDWNFIGNPYPSAISADTFFTLNSAVVGNAIYLWSHSTAPSNTSNGNQTLNYSSDDYAIINSGSGEVAGASGVIPDRYIPSGQGFFVQGLANGNATFNNAMRLKDNTSNDQFFRSTNHPNKLWLNLTSDNGVFNQVLVAYVNDATDGDDGFAFDSPRMLSSGTNSIIYTLIEGQPDTKYAIQGKSISSISTQEIIKLGFYTAIGQATIYKLSIAKLEGNFMNNQPIYIKDYLLNVTHNISQSDYTFTSEAGSFNNRFEIVFTEQSLGIQDETIDQNLIITEIDQNIIKVSTSLNSQIETVKLYNLQGKLVSNTSVNNRGYTIINIPNLSSSVYIVQAELDNNITINTKLIKHL